MHFISRHRGISVLLAAVILLVLYFAWSMAGRSGYNGPVRLNLADAREFGSDSGAGNIVAIQPWMESSDYSSGRIFQSKLEGYFQEAANRHWLRRNTVVVLPEYFGAWLLCAGEKRNVWSAPTVARAMRTKVLSNVPGILYSAFTAPCRDRLRYAVFRTSAGKMAAIYDGTLSHLARKYGVTIVGGSTILPSPSVDHGRLRAGRGALFNVTPVYRPTGVLYPTLTRKTFLTAEEQEFLSAGAAEELPVYDVPAGRMGVLICADSWFPQSYEQMHRKGAEYVVVPSFIQGDGALDHKWKGYSGIAPPSDVRKADIGGISQLAAWEKYAFPGRLRKSGIPFGMMVCLTGRLWDLGSDPCDFIIRKGGYSAVRERNGAVLINLWITKQQGTAKHRK